MKKSKNLEFNFGILALGLSMGMSGCQMKVNDKNAGGNSPVSSPAAASSSETGSSASRAPELGVPAVRVSDEAPAPGLAGVQIIYHSPLTEALSSSATQLADTETLKALAGTGVLEFHGEKDVIANLRIARVAQVTTGAVKNLSQQMELKLADIKSANLDPVKEVVPTLSGFKTSEYGATSALDNIHWTQLLGQESSDLVPVEVLYHLQYQDQERTLRVQIRRDHVVSAEEAFNDSKIQLGTLVISSQGKLKPTQHETQLDVIHYFGQENAVISNQALRDSHQEGQIQIQLATATGNLFVDYEGAKGLDGQIPTQVPEKPPKADDARLECTDTQIRNNFPCSLRPQQLGRQGGQGQPGNPGQDGFPGGKVTLVLDEMSHFKYTLHVNGGAGGLPSPGGPGGEGGDSGGPSYVWLQNIESRFYDDKTRPHDDRIRWDADTVMEINSEYNRDCGPGPGTHCMRITGKPGQIPPRQGPAGPQGPPSSTFGKTGPSGASCVTKNSQTECFGGNLETTVP